MTTATRELEDQAIAKAHLIEAEIMKLLEQSDKLIGPIAKAAVDRGDETEVQELIRKLPSGFWRTELRTFIRAIPKCHVCGTKKGLGGVGLGKYRCDSPKCIPF